VEGMKPKDSMVTGLSPFDIKPYHCILIHIVMEKLNEEKKEEWRNNY